MNLFDNVCHTTAHSELRYLYSNIKEHAIELSAFLNHIHGFVTGTENKIGKDLKMYSSDFFEYFYAGTYGETFRSSFIITLTSVAESHLKAFIYTFQELTNVVFSVKNNNGVLDHLKEVNRKYLNLNIDFNHKSIIDFKGLLAIRNSFVHSSGNMDYVEKYEPLIRQITRAYPSVELTRNGVILTTEKFCSDSLQIVLYFFFYLFKTAIRKFPNYINENQEFENNIIDEITPPLNE